MRNRAFMVTVDPVKRWFRPTYYVVTISDGQNFIKVTAGRYFTILSNAPLSKPLLFVGEPPAATHPKQTEGK